jgi:hypothetical protein
MPSQRLAAGNQTLAAASTANVVCNASNNEQVDATADLDMMELVAIMPIAFPRHQRHKLFVLWQEFEVGIGG